MEENKKPRLRFNLFDALILLLVLAVLGAALLLRDRGTGEVETHETTTMRYTVEFYAVPRGMSEIIRVGDEVVRSNDGVYLGKLVDVVTKPHQVISFSQTTGAFIDYTLETTDDIYLTIENEGYVTARDIFIGSIAVKVGESLAVRGKGYARIGYITAIDLLGAEAAPNEELGAGDSEAVYTVYFEEVRDFTIENVHVGDVFYEDKTGAILGTVRNIEVMPYVEYNPGPEGTPVYAVKPGRGNMVIELAGRCYERSGGYFLDGSAELKVGANIAIESRYIHRQSIYYSLLSVGTP